MERLYSAEDVVIQAKKEWSDEMFREEVEKEKQRLRTYKPWWHKIFPFIIIIKRR